MLSVKFQSLIGILMNCNICFVLPSEYNIGVSIPNRDFDELQCAEKLTQ